jgi:CHAT domain-containing protein/Tfp pilus assembly protein PilF
MFGLTFAQETSFELELLHTADSLQTASQYDSALLVYGKAIQIAEGKSNEAVIIGAYNGIGLTHIALSKYQLAENTLRESIEIGNSLLDKNHPMLASAYVSLGYCYSHMQRIQDAIDNYEIGIGMFRAGIGENNKPCAEAYSRLGAAYYLLGNSSQQAIELLEQSISIYQELKMSRTLEMARVFNDLANVLQDEQRFDQAIELHGHSLSIKKDQLEPLHPEIGVSNYNLGRIYYSMGDYTKASEHYHKTLEVDLHTFGPDHRWVGEDYYSIADCHTAFGNYELALKYAKKSADVLFQAFGPQNPRYGTSLMTTGQAYMNLEDPSNAMEYFQKALAIFEGSDQVFRDVLFGKANAHALIGVALSRMQRYEEALSHLEASVNSGLSTMMGYSNFMSENYRHIGDSHLALFNYQAAHGAYQKALDILTTEFGEQHPQVAETRGALATAFLEQGELEKALQEYQVALQCLVPHLSSNYSKNPPLDQLSTLPATLQILNQKAWAYRLLYLENNDEDQLEQSWETFQLALNLIDTLRIGFLEQGSKQSLLEHHLEIYERSLMVVQDLHKLNPEASYLSKAFHIMEKSKAFLLLTSLRESSAKKFANIPDEILEKEQAIKMKVAFYETRATTESDETRKIEWRGKAFEWGQSYDSLMAIISRDYPAYHQLKYNTEVVSLEDTQASLASDEAMLHYFLGVDRLFALAINKGEQLFFTYDLDSDILDQIEYLRMSLMDKQPFTQKYAKLSFEVYQRLIQPASHLLMGKKISVIPDGELNYFPFEVLTSSYKPDYQSYVDLPYLVFDHSFNYSFSATFLFATQSANKSNAALEYLAFAPAFNDRTESSIATSEIALVETVRGNLVELKGTKREANSISKYFDGKLFQDETATESQFKSEAPSSSIIHLATHAIVDDQNPMNSRLLFTSTKDSINDGDLFIWELYNLQLNAQMAVLSACNTGFGKLERGEGVMSLGRAFAYAGCPSIIMSLWPAQDEATADIMEYFYQEIADGASKDQALASAKKQYLQQADDLFAHPFYWAGFVAQGNPEALNMTQHQRSWYWLVMIVAVAGILLYRRLS